MRTILVTGATGAIGSTLVNDLLDEQDTRVRLLIRAGSQGHLDERLRSLFHFWQRSVEDASVTARVEAYVGDVTQSGLGLADATYRRLTREVTHVIHSAGNVKLNRSLDEARESAVAATTEVVAFAGDCAQSGQFEKLEYVSTVGVAGRIPGPVPERRLTEARSFHNTYEAAKAEAEASVLDAMDHGLAATIHRPSMVVGDSRSGRISQFQVFYYLCEFLSGAKTRGVIPDTGRTQLDIIPVDYVAGAIRLSSRHRELAGRILHLCSGPDLAPRVSDLAQRIRRSFVAQGRTAPPLRSISPSLVRALVPLARHLVGGKVRRSLDTVPHFLAYLETAQTFANDATRALLEPSGLIVPKVDDYVDVVLSYYLQSGAGHAQAGRGAA